MSWVQNAFTQMGYRVLFVPAAATELITGGVAPWTCGSNADFQKCQLRLQIEKEKVFEQAAATMPADKVLIVCDRGVLDNRAYMTAEEFEQAVAGTGSSEVSLRDQYDAVFHLVTAAKGAEAFYTTANNTARTETVEQAAALDDRLISAWTGHPHLRVIDNSTSFEEKMRRLVKEIATFLGEPEPYEIERRLSQQEYLRLLMDADTTRRQIRKTRYCLTYENQYFEIDLYPFWNDKATAEIELSDEQAPIAFPEQIRVIREVTDDDAYKNAALASR